MTDIQNLKQIVDHTAILSRLQLERLRVIPVDAAHSNIVLQRRAVTVPTGGCLLDYVPFYFNPKSPMLYAIKCKKVDSYDGDQARLVHIAVDVQKAVTLGATWTCTNRHAILAHAEFTSDKTRIQSHIDWDAIYAQYWIDPSDPDLKARRQAEFLVRDRYPLSAIEGIGVMTEMAKEIAKGIVGAGIEVLVKRDWYF